MTYKVVVTHTEEGYSVGCPGPGCWSEGDTKEEALDNIREAIEEYLSVQPKEELPSEVHFVEVPAGSGLNGSTHEAGRVPFVITPIMYGLPAEWTPHKVEDLLTILEGPDHRSLSMPMC